MSHSYDRRVASGKYTTLMSKLAEMADDLTEAGEKAKGAKAVASELLSTIQKDEAFGESDSDVRYGIKQQLEDLMSAFDKTVYEAKRLGKVYDDANKHLLAKGVK